MVYQSIRGINITVPCLVMMRIFHKLFKLFCCIPYAFKCKLSCKWFDSNYSRKKMYSYSRLSNKDTGVNSESLGVWAMSRMRQFGLLLWKNYVLQKRQPWVTLLELGAPTLFALVLLLVRTKVDSTYNKDPTYFRSYNLEHFPLNYTHEVKNEGHMYKTVYSSTKKLVLFSPELPHTTLVMKYIEETFNVVVKGYTTEDALLSAYENNSTAIKELMGAVIFDSESPNSKQFSQNIKVRMRFKFTPDSTKGQSNSPLPTWHTELSFPVFQQLGPRVKKDPTGGTPGYLKEGFLSLQHHITLGIAQTMRKSTDQLDNVTVTVQRFPYPPYNDDNFLFALKIFFPLALMLSFIYPSLNIVKNVVIEKEKRLKESMKMMGLSNWLHWSAWFLKYLIFLTLSLVVITALLSVKVHRGTAVLDNTDPTLLFVFLFVYIMATIAFCFMISTLFSKANSAAAGAGIIFFLAFIPYFIIFPRYNTLSGVSKVAACLLSNTALTMGAMVLTMWEGTGAGAQWSTFYMSSSQEDTLSMGIVTGMMLFDTFLYFLVAWYVEAVFPGEYGVPLPWYFPFTKSYWCTTYVELDALLSDEAINKKTEFFEKDPVGLMNGIAIIGLSKVFGQNKIAVNDVNMNMYKGQITALLGHNGAGKTTTISMLTGLFPPTTGTALVNGFDIREDIEGVHGSLGICPQHDVLFDTLTVEEHLYFFCKLKGYLPDLVQCEIDRMLKSLNLEDKRKDLAKTLSGGMKRRLSVGVALCGGSQVVMLDEPTSGMDPAARRFTWDLLQSEKEDRTILLTTHFMEEADILGDRIAIMAEGEVQCCGSPLFLKRKYGAGYHLVLVKDGTSCDVNAVNQLVMQHVPRAEQESNVGAELTYSLPHESSQAFPALFSQLENGRVKLGLAGYGASITTMEEVFLRVGDYSRSKMAQLAEKAPLLNPVGQLGFAATNPGFGSAFACNGSEDSGVYEVSLHSPGTPKVNIEIVGNHMEKRARYLFWQQFMALFIKSVLHSYRNWILTASQVFLPVAIIAVTLTVLKTLPKPENSPERILNLEGFRGSTIPYAVSPPDELKEFSDLFTNQFNPSTDKPEAVPITNGTPIFESLASYLVEKGKEDLPVYNLHCIVAMAAESNNSKLLLRSMFNNQAYHSPAIALATLENALLKYLTKNTETSLTFSNHPLPRTIAEKSSGQQNQGTEGYQVAQDLMFAMSFLMASFAPFLVRERSTKAKHLQRVSGVGLVTFWLSTYLWHFLNYMVPCLLLLLEFLAFNTEPLCFPAQSGRILLVFVLHGLASLPFIYVLSFLFNESATAYTRLTLINFIAGIACLLSVTIMEIPLLDLQDIASILDWTFSAILPQFCLGRAIYNLYQNYQYIQICSTPLATFACMSDIPDIVELAKPCCKGKCDDVCLPWDTNYLAWDIPGIGRLLTFLAVQCVFYNLLLVACELNVLRILKYRFAVLFSRKVQPDQPLIERGVESFAESASHVTSAEDLVEGFQEDEDVQNERTRILSRTPAQLMHTDPLVLHALSKRYPGGLLAVDNLCLGVHKGECFGLLGLNGAGKTTTFKMLTGDEQITSGDAFLKLFSVKTELRKVQQELGYCPQYDALIDQMTGYETLTLFARLRGVSESQILYQVETLSKLLYFQMHLNKMVKDYSGGNKRKLSTAVALIGDSPVVFLDEPTTGMDPVARRCLWDAILQVVREGRSVVLTSHSMEECEALCNRLAIMVNGRFCCLGSPQYLKNKFSQGFTLMVKVGRRSATGVSLKSLSRTGGAYSLHSFEVDATPFHENIPPEELFRRDLDEVKGFIARTFPNAVIKSIHQGLLHYQVPKEDHSWAQMFASMEEAKEKFNIENYSVGQTTLEQVFLNFARSQRHTEDS